MSKIKNEKMSISFFFFFLEMYILTEIYSFSFPRMSKWILLVAMSSLFFGVSGVFAIDDTSPTLDYIRHTEDGVYKIYGKNIPSSPNLVNIYIDNKKVDASNFNLTKEGVTVKNYYQNSGIFIIEQMKVEYGSGDIAKYVTDKKTDSVKVQKNNIVALS